MSLNNMIEDQHAFTDVISNTLGVLILITLISILLHGELSKATLESHRSEHITINFHAPRQSLFLPNSSYYIAIADRIVRWPVDEIADFLLKHPDKEIGKIPIGEFVFLDNAGYTGEETIPHDVDSYRLFFTTDLKSVRQLYPVMNNNDIKELMESLQVDYIEQNIVPLFFVYPSGMNIFSNLHNKIIQSGMRIRWRPAAKGNDIAIYRSSEQFDDFYLKR